MSCCLAVVYEETVAEVELHDVACPGAALHAMPPAAVLSTPRSQQSGGVARDAGFEGEQRVPLGRVAAAVGRRRLGAGDDGRSGDDGCCK